MRVHLINPSPHRFGTGVMTPRWLYVIAAATPAQYGLPRITDEILQAADPAAIDAGDAVGIGIHTANALRGYELGRIARRRGARVIFGGVHATLFPEEARQFGGAETVVAGDGEQAWPTALRDADAGTLQPFYDGGRLPADQLLAARWDLLPFDRYLWATVQTVRGCPKHCSFCSVWRTDGQQPRQRPPAAVLGEIVALRRLGMRFIVLADDNFYPVSLNDLRIAARNRDPSRLAQLTALRRERLRLLAGMAQLPHDMVFFTQITMEAGDDPEFLDAMHRANIKGVLVGVESVTASGLKDVYKDFNAVGEALVSRLRAFPAHGVHVLGSFIFGLPSDGPATFAATAELADRAAIAFAQFVPLTPLPGTLDFVRWEAAMASDARRIAGQPLTRYWLIPPNERPRVMCRHPSMAPEELRCRTQQTWDEFYSWRRTWRRSRLAPNIKSRIAFVLIAKLYRQMFANTGIAADSARAGRATLWARGIGRLCRRFFRGAPLPTLPLPTV